MKLNPNNYIIKLLYTMLVVVLVVPVMLFAQTSAQSSGTACVAPFETLASGTLRDLKKSHPDVESNSMSFGPTYKIADTLSINKKPIFVSMNGPFGLKSSFDTWYNDVLGTNMSMPYTIELKDTDKDGVYTYENSQFFPLDTTDGKGLLFGNEGNNHNYHFTYEAHTTFTYKPGQTFRFTGDDDLWVFINGKKAIDLAGVHEPLSASIVLDTAKASELGLVAGQVYSFDIFFAERHRFQSNFKIETSFDFAGGCNTPTPATSSSQVNCPTTSNPTAYNNLAIAVTADNYYHLMKGKRDGAGLVTIGKDVNHNTQGGWKIAESYTNTINADDYVYAAIWDDGSLDASFLGQFTLNGKTIYTNSTDWEYYKTSITKPSHPGDVDTLKIQEQIRIAGWKPAVEIGSNGVSPWGVIAGIGKQAKHLKVSGDTSNAVVIFRLKNPVQSAILGCSSSGVINTTSAINTSNTGVAPSTPSTQTPSQAPAPVGKPLAVNGYSISTPALNQVFTVPKFTVAGTCVSGDVLTLRATAAITETVTCKNNAYSVTMTFVPSAPVGKKLVTITTGSTVKAMTIIDYTKTQASQPATQPITTPTPTPQPSVVPEVKKVTAQLLTAPYAIHKGNSARILWRSTNATSCSGVGFNTGGLTSGSITFLPKQSAEYSVVCSNTQDSASARATLLVVEPGQPLSVSGGSVTPSSTSTPTTSSNSSTTTITPPATTNNSTTAACSVPFETLASGTLRDLKKSHPDVESNTTSYGPKYYISDRLSPDRKPVYTGSLGSVGSMASFNTWYNDVPGTNLSLPFTIDLKDADNDGIYSYASSEFFPLDTADGKGKLFGNEGNLHNYHFTYEAHTTFTYKPGQTFRFTGDDDLWVFINGKNVIDLGGVHAPESASVTLDSVKANQLGLIAGQTYSFDIFFAERHKVESNFKIETSFDFVGGCDIPTPTTTPAQPVIPALVPSPTATIVADPSAISQGASTTLTWGSLNADKCVGNIFNTNNAPSGALVVSPSSTTNYSVRCTQNSTSKSAEAVATVSVTQVAPVTATIETSIWEPSEMCGGSNTYSARVKFSEPVSIKDVEKSFVYVVSEGKNGIRRDLKLSYVKNNGSLYEYGDPLNQYKRFEFSDCGRSNAEGGSDVSKRYFIPNGAVVSTTNNKPLDLGRFKFSGNLPSSYVVSGSSLCNLPVCTTIPKVSLTADKQYVTEDGEYVLLTTSSENALYCVLNGGESTNPFNTSILNNDKKGTGGTYKVVQYATTTYVLTCTNGSGVSASASLTLKEAKEVIPAKLLSIKTDYRNSSSGVIISSSAQFNSPVTVVGVPRIKYYAYTNGKNDAENTHIIFSTYQSGSGTNTLQFKLISAEIYTGFKAFGQTPFEVDSSNNIITQQNGVQAQLTLPQTSNAVSSRKRKTSKTKNTSSRKNPRTKPSTIGGGTVSGDTGSGDNVTPYIY